MKLTRLWQATCAVCKTTSQVYNNKSNITQDRAVRKLREDGWSTTNGEPLCPACNRKRPGVIEVIKALKSAHNDSD